jgi:Arc/MetJ family transcription regulator
MRTNIEIDQSVVSEVMEFYGVRTKREAVDRALKQALRLKRQGEALHRLRGIGWEGDLDGMRTDKPLPEFG